MKIVEEKKKTSITLANKEQISISTTDGHIKITIKCLGNTLHIEEKTKDGLLVEDEEAKAIKAMKNYLKKQRKGK